MIIIICKLVIIAALAINLYHLLYKEYFYKAEYKIKIQDGRPGAVYYEVWAGRDALMPYVRFGIWFESVGNFPYEDKQVIKLTNYQVHKLIQKGFGR